MRIATRLILAAGFTVSLAPPGQEPPSFADVVQPYVDEGRFAGAVGVVVTRDAIVAFPAVGYADVATRKPMARDTLFWIASTSKPIEVTALMMLVDEGKV